MSSADRIRLAYIEESTFGTTPSGNLQTLRLTGESLRPDTQTTQSQEIRSDRQLSDIIRTNFSTSGDINFELSYGAYDDFLLAALQAAAWSAVVTVTASTISFAASSGGTQVVSDSGSGFGSIVVGAWVKITDAANAVNNGTFKVSAAAAGSITVNNASGIVEIVGASITVVQGAYAVNGVAEHYFTIEKEFTDNTNDFEVFVGQMIDSMDINVSVNQIITGRFGFLGKSVSSASATVGTGYDAATTDDIVNAVDHVGAIFENDGIQEGLEFNFSLNNNLRQRNVIGTLGPTSMGSGTLAISGSLRAYYENATLADKHLNFTETSLAIVVEDGSGSGYVFDFPAVKFTQGPRNASGQNTDIIIDLSFEVKREATEDCMVRVSKFA